MTQFLDLTIKHPQIGGMLCGSFSETMTGKPVSEGSAWIRRNFKIGITETRLKEPLDSINKGANAGRLI